MHYKNNKITKRENKTLIYTIMKTNFKHTSHFSTSSKWFSHTFECMSEFQRKMLPYADKGNLISAILFYEETLKSLNTLGEN